MADSCQCMTKTTAILWGDWPPTNLKKKEYIYLLGCAGSSLQHSGSFSCGMGGLVSQLQGQTPALGAQSLSN